MVLDETGRLAGRGAYLCRDAACQERGLSKGVLTRALGVPLPSGVRETLASTLAMVTTETTDKTTTMTSDEGGAGGQE